MSQDNDSSKDSIQVRELVYTSSKKLLDGGSDLGVVASSEDFPIEAKRSLQLLWSYDIPFGLKRNFPNRVLQRFALFLCGKNNEYLTYSRISMSTNVHLGRTTPIAHHLLVSTRELAAADLKVSDFVAWASGAAEYGEPFAFYKEWSGNPEYLKPRVIWKKSKINKSINIVEKFRIGSALEFQIKKLFAILAANLYRFRETTKSTIVISSEEIDNLEPLIMSFVLTLLPLALQLNTSFATQIWLPSDLPIDYHVIFCFKNSPYLENIKRMPSKTGPKIIGIENLASQSAFEKGSLEDILFNDISQNLDRNNCLSAFFDKYDSCARFTDITLSFQNSVFEFYNKVNVRNFTVVLSEGKKLAKLQESSGPDPKFDSNYINFLEDVFSKTLKHVVKNRDFESLLLIWCNEQIPSRLNQSCYNYIKRNYKECFSAWDIFNIFDDKNVRYNDIVDIVVSDNTHINMLIDRLEVIYNNSKSNFEKIVQKITCFGIPVCRALLDLIEKKDEKIGFFINLHYFISKNMYIENEHKNDEKQGDLQHNQKDDSRKDAAGINECSNSNSESDSHAQKKSELDIEVERFLKSCDINLDNNNLNI